MNHQASTNSDLQVEKRTPGEWDTRLNFERNMICSRGALTDCGCVCFVCTRGGGWRDTSYPLLPVLIGKYHHSSRIEKHQFAPQPNLFDLSKLAWRKCLVSVRAPARLWQSRRDARIQDEGDGGEWSDLPKVTPWPKTNHLSPWWGQLTPTRPLSAWHQTKLSLNHASRFPSAHHCRCVPSESM